MWVSHNIVKYECLRRGPQNTEFSILVRARPGNQYFEKRKTENTDSIFKTKRKYCFGFLALFTTQFVGVKSRHVKVAGA